jgi:hypothetical protein
VVLPQKEVIFALNTFSDHPQTELVAIDMTHR